MSFKTARDIFEKAQETALNRDEEAIEGIAAGLIELAKSMASEMSNLERKLNSLDQKVSRLK